MGNNIKKFDEYINEGIISKIKDIVTPSDETKKEKISELISEIDGIGLKLDRKIQRANDNQDGEQFFDYIDCCSDLLFNIKKIEKLSKKFNDDHGDKSSADKKITKGLKYISSTFPKKIKFDRIDGFSFNNIIEVIETYNEFAEKYNVEKIDISKFNIK